MNDDDELLRTLGAIAAEQEREDVSRHGLEPLGDLARERIVDAIVGQVAPPRRPTRSAVAVAVVGALAVAAAFGAAAARRGEPEPLPMYALYASGASSSRGPARAASGLDRPCTLNAGPEGSFELLASSDNPVSGGIRAHAFLVRRGEPQPWSGAIEVSPKGSVRVLDSANSLVGASELRIVIGRPEHLRGDDALTKARGSSDAGPGWQVLRCAIAIESN